MIDLTNAESKSGALAALNIILQSRVRKLRKQPGSGHGSTKLHMPKNVTDVQDDLDDNEVQAETSDQKKARLAKIQNELTGENGKKLVDQIKQETDSKRAAEMAKKAAAKKAEKDSLDKINSRCGKASDPILDMSQFRADFLRCLGDQLKISRRSIDTYRKPNAKFAGSNLMVPVSVQDERFEKPIINVYFDKSGSIPEAALQVAVAALKELEIYKRRKMCDFHIYYFADNVASDPADTYGGTGAFPEILAHIKQTKANNVIIITDDDFDLQTPDVGTPALQSLDLKGCV